MDKSSLILEFSESLQTVLNDHPEIQLVYLFGSAVSGHHHSESDLDSALLIEDDIWNETSNGLGYQATLVVELQDAFRRDRIDRVILNEPPPLRANQVVSNGELLYYIEPRVRNNFVVQTKNQYPDTKPPGEIKRRYSYRRIEEGIRQGRRSVTDPEVIS